MEQVKDLILTCDAGTTGLKCSLFNARGEAVRTVRRAYGTEYPHHNWADSVSMHTSKLAMRCAPLL